MEIWKEVKNFAGLYKISNLGRVYSIKRKRIMQNRPNKIRGYVLVSMSFSGIVKKIPVHRLVAEAFIPNPDNLPCINHKDEDRSNNCVDNLEWCTVDYNNQYGTRNEKLKTISGIRVAQYTLDGKLIKIWNSLSEASRSFGCKTTVTIGRVCKGVCGRKTYKGYIWRYVD